MKLYLKYSMKSSKLYVTELRSMFMQQGNIQTHIEQGRIHIQKQESHPLSYKRQN